MLKGIIEMSERGAAYYRKWITDNVMRGSVGADIISVAELTAKLFTDARAAGISEHEIEDEIGSPYEAILAAIVNPDNTDQPSDWSPATSCRLVFVRNGTFPPTTAFR